MVYKSRSIDSSFRKQFSATSTLPASQSVPETNLTQYIVQNCELAPLFQKNGNKSSARLVGFWLDLPPRGVQQALLGCRAKVMANSAANRSCGVSHHTSPPPQSTLLHPVQASQRGLRYNWGKFSNCSVALQRKAPPKLTLSCRCFQWVYFWYSNENFCLLKNIFLYLILVQERKVVYRTSRINFICSSG